MTAPWKRGRMWQTTEFSHNINNLNRHVPHAEVDDVIFTHSAGVEVTGEKRTTSVLCTRNMHLSAGSVVVKVAGHRSSGVEAMGEKGPATEPEPDLCSDTEFWHAIVHALSAITLMCHTLVYRCVCI